MSVDFATWSNVWNITALSGTTVDYLLDMGTYTNSGSSFSSQLGMVCIRNIPSKFLCDSQMLIGCYIGCRPNWIRPIRCWIGSGEC